MKTPLALIASLLLSATAFAQSKVYTNADLGKPLTYTHAPAPGELDWLLAHQYVYIPPADGPDAVIVPWTASPVDEPSAPPAPLSYDSGMPYGWVPYGVYGRGGFGSARMHRSHGASDGPRLIPPGITPPAVPRAQASSPRSSPPRTGVVVRPAVPGLRSTPPGVRRR